MKGVLSKLLKVQKELAGVAKDSKNPHFKNSYASLEAVLATVRPVLSEAELVLVQTPGDFADGNVQVTTMVGDPDTGEVIEAPVQMPVGKKVDPQGIGSAITYARRYGVMALLGLAETDDDGNAGSGHGKKQQRKAAPPPEQDDPLPALLKAIAHFGGFKKTMAILAEEKAGVRDYSDKVKGKDDVEPWLREQKPDTIKKWTYVLRKRVEFDKRDKDPFPSDQTRAFELMDEIRALGCKDELDGMGVDELSEKLAKLEDHAEVV